MARKLKLVKLSGVKSLKHLFNNNNVDIFHLFWPPGACAGGVTSTMRAKRCEANRGQE